MIDPTGKRESILRDIDDATSPENFPDKKDALVWLQDLVEEIETRIEAIESDVDRAEDEGE